MSAYTMSINEESFQTNASYLFRNLLSLLNPASLMVVQRMKRSV